VPAYEAHQPLWPNQSRVAACLTFDFDAESLWLSRDPSTRDRPGVLSQGTYGAKVAVPRILELLDQEAVKATFFIPGWVAENHESVCRAIRDAGHEIGHHGYLHERNRPEDPDSEREAFRKGLESLQQVLGVRPVGYRSPGWDLTPITLDLVREAGMLYSSNLMDDAWPYVHASGARSGPGSPSVVELPVQWSVDDAPFFLFNPQYAPRTIQIPWLVYGAFREELIGAREWGGLFNLTMHPQVSGHPSRLRQLRGLIRTIKELEGVWLATCAEIAQYWLDKSLDGQR
jgi:peptidoglycan/xylan/chitin deacetylase (PgdA/CDA1 family)